MTSTRECSQFVSAIFRLSFLIHFTLSLEEVWNDIDDDFNFRNQRPYLVSTYLDVKGERRQNFDPFTQSNRRNTFDPGSFSTGERKQGRWEDELYDTTSDQYGGDKFYDFQDGRMQTFVHSSQIEKNSPKIKFYSMNCTMGFKCNAIIPGPKTEVPSFLQRNGDDMRNYLRKYGLENGFNYSPNDRINRHSVVARYFPVKHEGVKYSRNPKKLSEGYFDYDDFWPGAEYRPKKGVLTEAKIYKFETGPKQKYNNDRQSWGNNHNSNPETPRPSFSNPYPYPYEDKPIKSWHPDRNWNRYSKSIISQYDRRRNDWVRLSNGNAIGTGVVGFNIKPTDKPSHWGANDPIRGSSITVLGAVPESLISYPDRIDYRPTRRPAHFDYPSANRPSYVDYKPPKRPTYLSFPSSEKYPQHVHQVHEGDDRKHLFDLTPSGKSVSFPLEVLPPQLRHPFLVYHSLGNITTSNHAFIPDEFSTTTTIRPTTNHHLLKTTSTTTTTRIPKQEQQQPNTSEESSGGGGGGGLIDNRYAVMAAVGAGLIPASIAAILPVIVGRKRRKRSIEDSPSVLYHIFPKDDVHFNPVLMLLHRNYYHAPTS